MTDISQAKAEISPAGAPPADAAQAGPAGRVAG